MLSLDRYQELLTLPVNAFNGINLPTEPQRYQCATIWKKSDRSYLSRFLDQAELMREKELKYFLTPKYIVDEVQQNVRNPHILKNKFLIALGEVAETVLEAGVGITYGTDPLVITVSTTGIIDLTELRVYKYDANGVRYPVTPSFSKIAGGTLTLNIFKARLVDPDAQTDADDPLDYYDDDNFVDEIDVIREYTDPSQAVSYFWHECNVITPTTHAGYAEIDDARLSIIKAFPASWSGLTPTFDKICTQYGTKIHVSYLSGRLNDSLLDTQTIRLAHTLMPYEPCTCEPVHQYWLADTGEDPSHTLTPYGNSVGAMAVWIADSRSKIGFSTTTGGIRSW